MGKFVSKSPPLLLLVLLAVVRLNELGLLLGLLDEPLTELNKSPKSL